jgi:hypothetical protein
MHALFPRNHQATDSSSCQAAVHKERRKLGKKSRNYKGDSNKFHQELVA